MGSSSSTLNAMLITVIIVATLYLAREVLLPIGLACILGFMLAPPVRMLQNRRVPRGLAVAAVVLLTFFAIFALGSFMAREVSRLAKDLPRYEATISAKIDRLQGVGTGGTLERAQQVLVDLSKQLGGGPQKPSEEAAVQEEQTAAIPVEVREPRGAPLRLLSKLIDPLLGPLATTAIIIVFVIFILMMREDLRDRLIRLAGSTDIPHTTAAIDDAARRLSRLFLAQLAINTGFGILVGLGLAVIGIPSPFVWGVLAGILRFIPFIGPILGLIFPVALSVSVDPGWSMMVWTIALFLGLEIITGQIIEPVIQGHSTGLSPVAVVVAATFWAWLWGPVGLVLAVPLTVILVVLGRHVDALKFFDVLLGDKPALSEAEGFYQRMLARDPIEAIEQAKSYMTTHSLSGYCDEVVRPALMLAQKDAERGVLEDDKKIHMRETVEALSADIAHEHWLACKEADMSTTTSAAKLPVLDAGQLARSWQSPKPLLVIGARTELDQAAAAMFSTLVEMHGIPARVERAEMLTACNIGNLDLSGVALMCVSSVDMRTPAHIHFAARRLKSRAPRAKLLLGLWSAKDDEAGAELKNAVGADDFARSFHQAAAIILQEATTADQEPRTKAPARASAAHT
ncbi:AI-2E family transporter [Bradyrhizobium sp. Tv2a-2]|uniref:AI-2E family transporter n=1 Tax=Bradyrhizobium sp. Tv2a-2 TaxID=113395 RepID=UPI0004293D85|nr:AI-2E family transporter [Bradyrhizobium sp. Tv2a-2]